MSEQPKMTTCDRCGRVEYYDYAYQDMNTGKRLCHGCARQWRKIFKEFMKEGRKCQENQEDL